MASVTYGKGIMGSVIMAKVLWQMKLSPFDPEQLKEIKISSFVGNPVP